MIDGNGNVPPGVTEMLQPIADLLGPVVSTLSWVMGGFIGVYMLYLGITIYQNHHKNRILKEIRDDVCYLRQQTEIADKKRSVKPKKKSKK